MVGRPNNPSFLEDLKALEDVMKCTCEDLAFKKGEKKHRRGAYPTLVTRISYGGGSKVNLLVTSKGVFVLPFMDFRSQEIFMWEVKKNRGY